VSEGAPIPRRLTPEDLAFIFGVSDRTVSSWIAGRMLSFFRVGRVVRFSPESVLAFIAANSLLARQQMTVRVADSLVLLQTHRLLSLVMSSAGGVCGSERTAAFAEGCEPPAGRSNQPKWQNEETPRTNTR
jgi:excisionase family DNA binding protein